MLLRSSGGGLPATYLLVVLAIVVVVPGVVYGLHPKEMPANYFSFEPNLPPRHHLFKEEDNLFIEGEAAAASIKLLKGVCGQRTQWIVKDHYSSNHNGLTHLYLRQIHNGLEIANSPANINVDKSGRVINLGEVCYKVIQDEANLRSPTLTAMEALLAVASHLGLEDKIDLSALNVEASSFWDTGRVARSFVIQGQGLHSKGFLEQEQENVSMELAYLQNEARRLNLTWHTVLRLKDNWFDVHVDAHTGKVLSLIDWVRWDSYEAYAIPNEDPLLGDRQTLTNPADKTASPIGWLDQGTGSSTQFTTTVGNNVYAQLNPTGRSGWTYNYRPDGDKTLSFQFPIDFFSEPYQYRDAAVTNLFFWNNVIHDIFYLRGFNESAGNFQENNFNKGGLGNDAVQANAQDGSGYNNANFATPPDGQRPRMRMYLWNQVTPMIDGDLDSGIIVHEYGHGISTRLTGGPNNSNCLASGQAGGMGEGWGDFWATIFLQTPQYKPSDAFPMGIYAAGRGIRPYPYSADFNVDPQTYGYINKQGYNQEYDVHAKGSVWCTILWEVYWEMVTKHGFDSDWYRGSGGNNALLQDVVDGLKLQPCRPNFVDARNAILLADKQNYGGKYVCDMWAAFARRGLGYSAVGDVKPVVEAFDVPTVCLQN